MQEQMSGAAMAMPADTNKAFKVNSVVSSVEVAKASPVSICSFASRDFRPSGRHWSWLITCGHWRTSRRIWWAESWTLTACSARSCRLASSDVAPGVFQSIVAGICFWVRTTDVGYTSLYVMQSLQSIHTCTILESPHSSTGFISRSSILDSLASLWRYFGIFVFSIVKMCY